MLALIQKYGHKELKINFDPFISLAGKEGVRLSEVAEILGISRQAATQIANKIEAAGYLQRATDPDDGRAKLLLPTPRGKLLINQGMKEAIRLQKIFESIVGKEELLKASEIVAQINRSLALRFRLDGERKLLLAAVLPRLSEFMAARLQSLTVAKKHPGVKHSHAAVFFAIGLEGGRIQQIAKAQHVTKQAISVVANELEELGYIERLPDPEDSRQLVLWFTKKGRQFIADSVEAIDDLEHELSMIVGNSDFQHLKNMMASLYSSLNIKRKTFGSAGHKDLKTMAKQLKQQLGDESAAALAQFILLDLTAN